MPHPHLTLRAWTAGMILTVAIVLAACNRQTIYSHYQSIGSDGWSDKRMLLFDVDAVRDSAVYRELLEVRITEAYPFTNLALIVERRLKHSGLRYCDTLTVNITDADGHFSGQGTNHHLYHVPLPDVVLPKQEQMQVYVRHCMAQHTLPGVTDVGLTVIKK